MKVGDFEDKVLRCIDCEEDFIWKAGEQAFFASKELSTPKRCYVCRKARKATLVKEERGNGY